MKLVKGQRIKVSNNEIFEMMGYKEVTGTVFVVNPNGKSVSIQCDQTRCIELVEVSESKIQVIG
jgi:hypothetical protein